MENKSHNHSCSHNHAHDYTGLSGSKYLGVIILNGCITLAEIIGGIMSGSLSLLSDAVHNFSDTVSMVLADQDGWDRYEAAKWLTMRRWLEENPNDELAKDVRDQLTSEPERYASYTREYLGWGVFALMRK